MTLPRTLDELTPDWLTAALSCRAPGPVVKLRRDRIGDLGTTTNVFLK